MEKDIDYLIILFKKFTKNKEEMAEQESSTSSSSGGETGGSSEGGSAKSVKKWESGRTFGKTYMNDPKYKWESGRTFGPTYNPGQVWTGAKKGKANPSDFA